MFPDPAEGTETTPETLGSTEAYNPFQDEPSGGEEQPAPPVPPTTEVPPASPMLGITQDQLRDLVSGVATAVGPRQEAQAPTMTAEEFNRTFNVVQVTPEMLRGFGIPVTEENMATVQTSFDQYGQGLVRQAMTMSQYVIKEQMRQMSERYAPIELMYRQQEAEKLKQEFLTQHKDLKGWEPLLDEIKNRLLAEGFRANSKEELFKMVAEKARAIVQKVNADRGVQPQQPATSQGASRPRMSTVATTGGQGGAGTNGGTQKTTTAKELWG